MTQSAALPQRGPLPQPASALEAATDRPTAVGRPLATHGTRAVPATPGRAITGSSIRRTVTVLGVILSLAIGILTIRAAAAWTASAAPLEVAPPTLAELGSALELERARSQALLDQLDRLSASSADLEAALAAAEQRIAQDATDADALNASLAAARQRLATLEASLGAARAPAAPAAPAAAPTAAPAAGAHDGGHDGEHEHDDD